MFQIVNFRYSCKKHMYQLPIRRKDISPHSLNALESHKVQSPTGKEI
jgi:hypothetical protein